ncbi:MAG: molybdopterin-dependent oxidoreductase [Planctomycetes bacterium]|nr:molybdopterin-dependent oxidoreductase [Planctomycetota bacterium]
MKKQEKQNTARRDFLRGALAAAGGFALAGCRQTEDPYALNRPAVPGTAGYGTHQEKWFSSACSQCWAGCGIRVRVVEGRAVRIDGNVAHPINRGTLGPKGQSGLQVLYHPDRFKGPVRRDGPRGSGKWTPVSWDTAIGEIGKTLQDIRSRGESRGVLLLDGEPRGMMRDLWSRFATVYGTPNHVDHRAASDGGKLLAMAYMHGVPEIPAYDWNSTGYVLGFGASLFESWCQSIHFMRSSSALRRNMPGKRVKFVQISPRHSTTASRADEWVDINPATYGALALGLSHVIVRDGLCDQEFVKDHTFGFEDWTDAAGKKHRGYKDLLLTDYPPEKVSKITGVSKKTIERLARELVDHRPAIALADGGAAAATNGLGTAMSIHALNALLGNIERPGGMVVQRPAPYAPWPDAGPDEGAKKGLASERLDGSGASRLPLAHGCIQALPDAILAGAPYAAQAAFLYRSNPAFSKPGGKRWTEAFQKIPLVVSFSPLPDESTFQADFVLPDRTYLERWEVVEPVPSVGHPIVSFRQPVVEPLYDTRATGDVLIQIAKAVGGPVGDAFPWDTWRKAVEERLQSLLNVEDSSIVAGKLSDLRKGMEKDSGWWSPGFKFEQWADAFRTPSGKFEFYSQEIARKLAAVPDLERELTARGVVTRGDDLCLPHWELPRFSGSAAEFPFTVAAYRGIEYAEGGSRHVPWLREISLPRRDAWKQRVELHPDDAKELKLAAGDTARVETPAGSARMSVAIIPGMRRGMIGIPLGQGKWPPKPDDTDPSGGYALLANAMDPLAGILTLQETRARITREKRT